MRYSLARMRLACAAFLIVAHGTCWAADIPDPDGQLTLSRAIAAALAANPDLAASLYEITAADARTQQAGLRPNPELSFGIEDFGGSGIYRGTHSLQSTLSLGQVVELGDKRLRRMDAASAAHDVIGIERQAQQLDVLANVTARFIDVVEAQEQEALAGRATALAQQTLDAIATRVAAARSPEAELSRARIALVRAQIDARAAQSTVQGSRHQLAASWGSTTPRFDTAMADLYALRPVESFESLRARLQRNPDLLVFASEARRREAELRLAQAQARPSLTLSLGVRREGTGNGALVAGFSMPLRLFDRNQGVIRENQVRLDQTGAQRRAAALRIDATLYALYQQLLAAESRTQVLREQAIPAAEAALRQTQVGYERGRFSYLELATAQQDLLTLQGAAISAAADFHRLQTEIERLTGEPLSDASTAGLHNE